MSIIVTHMGMANADFVVRENRHAAALHAASSCADADADDYSRGFADGGVTHGHAGLSWGMAHMSRWACLLDSGMPCLPAAVQGGGGGRDGHCAAGHVRRTAAAGASWFLCGGRPRGHPDQVGWQLGCRQARSPAPRCAELRRRAAHTACPTTWPACLPATLHVLPPCRRNPDAFTPEGEEGGLVPYTFSRPIPSDPALSLALEQEAVRLLGPEGVCRGLNATADSFYSSQGRCGGGGGRCEPRAASLPASLPLLPASPVPALHTHTPHTRLQAHRLV